jgi:chemotaxis protein MotB
MVIIFILLVFTAGQFYLSEALSGRDQALKQLQAQVSELSQLLSTAQDANTALRANTAQLNAQLASMKIERDTLTTRVAELAAKADEEKSRADAATGKLADLDTTVAADAQKVDTQLKELESLRRDIAALREQLARIAAALDVSEAKVKVQQGQIVELGKRLNLALVSKVEELSQYRSEFFGKVRQIIANRPDIRIVGDRFVFQSEVLFAPGQAELTDPAKQQLGPIFMALKDIAAKIPSNIDWVLRVDGHTDHRKINTPEFPSNWELSTARAISVVQYAIAEGIPANHIAAAGFADNQPLDPADTPEAYRRNRRIELKLTDR